MNRRSFIRAALSAAVGAALLPRIPLVAPTPPAFTVEQALQAFQLVYAKQIREMFFKPTPLYDYFKRTGWDQTPLPFDGGTRINAPIFDPKTFNR